MDNPSGGNKLLPEGESIVGHSTNNRMSHQAKRFLEYLATSCGRKTIRDFVIDEKVNRIASPEIEPSIKNSLERMVLRLYRNGLLIRQRSRDGYYEYSLSPYGSDLISKLTLPQQPLRKHPRHEDEEIEAKDKMGRSVQ